jgi:GAF domain-containing protein
VASGPRFRFYAGAPLTLSNGTRAETLCVVDRRPRVLDDGQLAELRRLAALATAELEADCARSSTRRRWPIGPRRRPGDTLGR